MSSGSVYQSAYDTSFAFLRNVTASTSATNRSKVDATIVNQGHIDKVKVKNQGYMKAMAIDRLSDHEMTNLSQKIIDSVQKAAKVSIADNNTGKSAAWHKTAARYVDACFTNSSVRVDLHNKITSNVRQTARAYNDAQTNVNVVNAKGGSIGSVEVTQTFVMDSCSQSVGSSVVQVINNNEITRTLVVTLGMTAAEPADGDGKGSLVTTLSVIGGLVLFTMLFSVVMYVTTHRGARRETWKAMTVTRQRPPAAADLRPAESATSPSSVPTTL